MGGGGFTMGERNPALDRHVLALTGKPIPKVCFIPTASGDTREQALRFYTRNNAYITFRENSIGSLEVGKLADFAILDTDLLSCPDAAIRDAQAALWSVLRLVVEPGGAASVAALLSRAYVPGDSERVGVILSGANTTSVDFEAA